MNKILSTVLIFLALVQISLAKDENKKLPTRFESLSKLTQVIGIVEKYYVDDIKFDEIVNKTLKGLMQELDAHSSFLDKKSSNEMKIQTTGEFGGLGITIGLRKGALTIISPIDDTPAFHAGVKASDIILKINNSSTLNMTLDEAVSLMRGKPKTSLILTIIRKGELKPLKIKIVRDIIKIKSVFAKKIENTNILYLRISSFDNKVVRSLKKEIKNRSNISGLILDLRNNPGGLLSQAIGVSDLFINKGVIVSQKGRDALNEEKFYSKRTNTITNVPIIVLINAGSASASEIVSGALQDHKRAILVGEQTFGKGSVQAILPIIKDKSESIKITIAKYYLPSGRTIQAKGIIPDVIVYPGKVISEVNSEFKIKESDLKKHLKVELDKDNGVKKSKIIPKSKKNISIKEILQDNQLNTAIGILQSLIIINNRGK